MSSAIDADKPNAGAALTSDVRANALAAKTELNDLHRISEDSVTSTGTNTIVATYSPAATGPTSGQLFGFKAGGANTGATTFDPNGLGALAVQVEGVALAAGQIQANGQYILKYDGSVYQLLNPSPRVVSEDFTLHAAAAANIFLAWLGDTGGHRFIHSSDGDTTLQQTDTSGVSEGNVIRTLRGAGVELFFAGIKKFETTTNGVNVVLPTSAAGLSSGDLWNDSGTVKIV